MSGPGDFVDFIDVDDSLLGPLHIVIGDTEKFEDDVLNIFANIARFGQSGGIHDRERDIQNLCQSLSN